MLGLFSLFGRSRELKALDQALREAGVHPQAVPEAVKLAAIRLLKDDPVAVAGDLDNAYGDAAQLLGYCMLGREPFIDSNGVRAAESVEERLEAAASEGDGRDANLALLALYARVMVPEVAELFEVQER